MANNRLFIVNKETMEWICLAKAYDYWYGSEHAPLERFIGATSEGVFGGDCPFMFVMETQSDMYKKYIAGGTMFELDGNP